MFIPLAAIPIIVLFLCLSFSPSGNVLRTYLISCSSYRLFWKLHTFVLPSIVVYECSRYDGLVMDYMDKSESTLSTHLCFSVSILFLYLYQCIYAVPFSPCQVFATIRAVTSSSILFKFSPSQSSGFQSLSYFILCKTVIKFFIVLY